MLTVWYNTVLWGSRYPAVILLVCIVICRLLPKYYKDIISSTLESLEKENFKLHTVLVCSPLRAAKKHCQTSTPQVSPCFSLPAHFSTWQRSTFCLRWGAAVTATLLQEETEERDWARWRWELWCWAASFRWCCPSVTIIRPMLRMDLRWVYRGKKLKQRLHSRWIQMSYCLVSINGSCAGTSYDLKMNSKQGTSENQSCSSDNQCTRWYFIYWHWQQSIMHLLYVCINSTRNHFFPRRQRWIF